MAEICHNRKREKREWADELFGFSFKAVVEEVKEERKKRKTQLSTLTVSQLRGQLTQLDEEVTRGKRPKVVIHILLRI